MLSLKKYSFNKSFSNEIPTQSGIYVFWKDNSILYIGKAKNLKLRLKSYLNINLFPKTDSMINSANYYSLICTENELQSLLLEAKLINEYKPKYNTISKDDKSPLYLVITKDLYPRVIMARKDILKNIKYDSLYGPFPSSGTLRYVFNLLRKIFNFSTHLIGKKPCLQSQIDLCSPCPNYIESIENVSIKKIERSVYMKNIKSLKNLLEGKETKVLRDLTKDMNFYAKNMDYENALKLKNKITRLEYILQPVKNPQEYLKNPNLADDLRKDELKSLKNFFSKSGIDINSLKRIECYDISHHSGHQTTASMVVFVNAISSKYHYRRFKIYSDNNSDDINSLEEVAKRRIKHLKDWGIPNLILVDGGIGQLKAFEKYFKPLNITCVSLEKKTESLIIPVNNNEVFYKRIKLKKSPEMYLLQKLRDEAHRFARNYHRKLVSKLIRENN